jgi:hypothetical protein
MAIVEQVPLMGAPDAGTTTPVMGPADAGTVTPLMAPSPRVPLNQEGQDGDDEQHR